jgi:DNA-directed RNA polymerase III subunit RPC6
MSGEEAMVLSYIQAAGNEGMSSTTLLTPSEHGDNDRYKGIWTKHLKAKTELHQTVIDRILKSLLQKTLIKVVKSVKVGVLCMKGKVS